MIETSSVPPRKSSAIFEKCSETFVKPSEQFWKIFGNFRKVVGNLRKIIKNGIYIINRIIHGRLEIWNLSSRVHIGYLTHSLRSLVRYRCELSKINSISPRTHVLFSIYLFMYFFVSLDFKFQLHVVLKIRDSQIIVKHS